MLFGSDHNEEEKEEKYNVSCKGCIYLELLNDEWCCRKFNITFKGEPVRIGDGSCYKE